MLVNVIDDNATLADEDRAAGDYDNSSGFDLCIVKLTVHFDTTAPSIGKRIADLYVVPGDGESTEQFAQGGDAGLGTDVTPQRALLVGAFETRSPSTTTDEILMLTPWPLYPHGNRFVLVNTSGQVFNLAWQLDIVVFNE